MTLWRRQHLLGLWVGHVGVVSRACNALVGVGRLVGRGVQWWVLGTSRRRGRGRSIVRSNRGDDVDCTRR